MNDIEELIATAFTMRNEFGQHNAVEFNRTISPFYSGERWAVRKLGNCLDINGVWVWEPRPSARDDEFYARCRFATLERAVWVYKSAMAKEAKP